MSCKCTANLSDYLEPGKDQQTAHESAPTVVSRQDLEVAAKYILTLRQLLYSKNAGVRKAAFDRSTSESGEWRKVVEKFDLE